MKQFSIQIRLDWSDLDLFGHVNNVCFYRFMQSGRVNFWEKTGIYNQFKDENIGPLLASAKCDFIKPLYYPDTITIISELHFIKNTSFGLQHKIYNSKNELCADASDVMVYFDFNKNEKVRFPEKFRQKFEG